MTTIAALGALLPNWMPGTSLEASGIEAIDQTLHHQIETSGKVQLYIHACLFGLISFVYIVLMFIRLIRHYNGGERIWFFRTMRRKEGGVYVVPHAGWCWSVPFTIFNIISLVLNIIHIRAWGVEMESEKSMRTLEGLASLVGNLAGWFQVFSMFLVAVQTKESYRPKDGSSGKTQYLNSLPPAVFNAIQFGVPIVFIPLMIAYIIVVSMSWISLYSAMMSLRQSLVQLNDSTINSALLVKVLEQGEAVVTGLSSYWPDQQRLYGSSVLWTLILVALYVPIACYLIYVSNRSIRPRAEGFSPKPFQLRNSTQSTDVFTSKPFHLRNSTQSTDVFTPKPFQLRNSIQSAGSTDDEKTLHSPTSPISSSFKSETEMKITPPSHAQIRLLCAQLMAFILFIFTLLVTGFTSLAYTFSTTFLNPQKIQTTILITNWVQAIFGLAVAYVFLLRTIMSTTPKKSSSFPTSATTSFDSLNPNSPHHFSRRKSTLQKALSWATFKKTDTQKLPSSSSRNSRSSQSTLCISVPSRDNQYYKSYTSNFSTIPPFSPLPLRAQSISLPAGISEKSELHYRRRSVDSKHDGIVVELGVAEFMADTEFDEFRWESDRRPSQDTRR